MKTKFSIKAVAALLAMAATPNVFAALALSSQSDAANGNGSDLMFFVVNFDTNQSYVRDLGLRGNQFLPTSNPTATDGFNYDIGAAAPVGTTTYPGLYNSTSNQAAGYTIKWSDQALPGLFGGNFSSARTGWGIIAAGSNYALTTSTNFDTGTATPADGNTIKAQLNSFAPSVNAATPGAPDVLQNTFFFTANGGDPANALGMSFLLNPTALNFTTFANVGGSENFYRMNTTGSALVSTQYAGLFSLNSDGVLTYSVAAVPEPSGLVLATLSATALAVVSATGAKRKW
jgi:hypothetical protein